MRLTIDSSSAIVTSDIAEKNINLGTFINKLQRRYVNLGLLPPVVRLITPIVGEFFYVLIECRPRMQTILFSDKAYTIPLPWHTVCLQIYHNPRTDRIRTNYMWLWFHDHEAMSEFDFNFDFYRLPWIPNVNSQGGVCFNESFHEYPSPSFSELWNEANDMLWTTPFNYDYSTAVIAYSPSYATAEEEGWLKLWDDFLTGLSQLTLEQACAKELVCLSKEEKRYMNIPFFNNLPSINPVLTLMDMFKAIQ